MTYLNIINIWFDRYTVGAGVGDEVGTGVGEFCLSLHSFQLF